MSVIKQKRLYLHTQSKVGLKQSQSSLQAVNLDSHPLVSQKVWTGNLSGFPVNTSSFIDQIEAANDLIDIFKSGATSTNFYSNDASAGKVYTNQNYPNVRLFEDVLMSPVEGSDVSNGFVSYQIVSGLANPSPATAVQITGDLIRIQDFVQPVAVFNNGKPVLGYTVKPTCCSAQLGTYQPLRNLSNWATTNDNWQFIYAAGLLKFAQDAYPAKVNKKFIKFTGFQYIGPCLDQTLANLPQPTVSTTIVNNNLVVDKTITVVSTFYGQGSMVMASNPSTTVDYIKGYYYNYMTVLLKDKPVDYLSSKYWQNLERYGYYYNYITPLISGLPENYIQPNYFQKSDWNDVASTILSSADTITGLYLYLTNIQPLSYNEVLINQRQSSANFYNAASTINYQNNDILLFNNNTYQSGIIQNKNGNRILLTNLDSTYKNILKESLCASAYGWSKLSKVNLSSYSLFCQNKHLSGVTRVSYYDYLNIDEITGCYLYLTSTQTSFSDVLINQTQKTSADFYDNTFICDYAIDDIIDYVNGSHYGYCAKIDEISGNRILLINLSQTLRTDLRKKIIYNSASASMSGYRYGWSEALTNDNPTYDISDYSISVQQKTLTGLINVSKNQAYIFGDNNAAAGKYVYARGEYNKVYGDYSTAIGKHNTARGYGQLLIGNSNYAEEVHSIAIGSSTSSFAGYGFSIGKKNKVFTSYSFACGSQCTVSGSYSYAGGCGNTTNQSCQYVIGKYNKPTTGMAFIIGNGTSITKTNNIYELDWNGNSKQVGTISANRLSIGTGLSSSTNYQVVLGTYNTVLDNCFVIVGNGKYNLKANTLTTIKSYIKTYSKNLLNKQIITGYYSQQDRPYRATIYGNALQLSKTNDLYIGGNIYSCKDQSISDITNIPDTGLILTLDYNVANTFKYNCTYASETVHQIILDIPISSLIQNQELKLMITLQDNINLKFNQQVIASDAGTYYFIFTNINNNIQIFTNSKIKQPTNISVLNNIIKLNIYNENTIFTCNTSLKNKQIQILINNFTNLKGGTTNLYLTLDYNNNINFGNNKFELTSGTYYFTFINIGQKIEMLNDPVKVKYEYQQPEPDYLTFTNNTASSNYIQLAKTGTPYTINLMYKFSSNEDWNIYDTSGTAGTQSIIEVPAGQSIKFYGSTQVFSKASKNIYTYKLSGDFYSSGNIMSLVNFRQDVGAHMFRELFKNCNTLLTPPTLPALNIQHHCYSNMFYNCSTLLSAPILPASNLYNLCYDWMFKDCINLNSVSANFNNWYVASDGRAATNAWLAGTPSGGTFYGNPQLPLSTGVSFIPAGWTSAVLQI